MRLEILGIFRKRGLSIKVVTQLNSGRSSEELGAWIENQYISINTVALDYVGRYYMTEQIFRNIVIF